MKNDTAKTNEQEILESIEETQTPKTFTEEQVKELLEKQKAELREKTVEKIAEKNKEIKTQESALLSAGQDEFYDLTKWEVMKKMASDMVQSGALPKGDNAYTVMVKMQAGREMGLKPMEAIKSLYVVNGIVSIYGDAVIRRLREHGWTLLPYEEKENYCKATIKKNGETYTDTFTYEEAVQSGWANESKPGWKKGINRKRKLRYGVISTLIKTYVPEVLGAATDITEVVADTGSMFQKKNFIEEATYTEDQLSDDVIAKINETKNLKDLVALCKTLKGQVGSGLQKPLLNEYNRRKAELEQEGHGQS